MAAGRASRGLQGHIIAVDTALPMLRRARQALDHEGWTHIHLVRAQAEVLPLATASLDGNQRR